MKCRTNTFFVMIFSLIFLLSMTGIFASCANPNDPRGMEETSQEETTTEEPNGEEPNGESEDESEEEESDEESEDESNGEESEDEESKDESDDEESDDDSEDEEEENNLDPHDNEFYQNHPEVTGGTIFADDFWIGSQAAGSESWVKVKLYNYFQRTVKVRVAIEESSSITEFYAPIGFLITGEIPFLVPESLGWHNLMITILDTSGNLLYHDKTSWFVQIQ